MSNTPVQHNSGLEINGYVNPPSLKNKAVLLGMLTFVILFFLTGFLVYQRYLIKNETERKALLSQLTVAKEKIQKSLDQCIAVTYTLSFLVQDDGTIKDFDTVAPKLLATNPAIDILEMVPEGVIKNVYPLSGNERVIGYNILKDSTRNKDAFSAIKRNELYFAGPLQLRQGGVAVVGRLPVFRKHNFWGFSCVVIKMPTLLKTAGINANNTIYHFQLAATNPDTHKEEYFLPASNKPKYDNFISISLPNGQWKLSVARVSDSGAYYDIFLLGLIGCLFAALGGRLVYVIARSPAVLNELVRKRTMELEDSENKYRSLIEQASDGVIVYNFAGDILQFNKAAYMESGYSEKEFAKLNLKELLVEKSVQVSTAELDELNTTKKTSFHRKLKKKDGDVIDIELNVSLLLDGNMLAFIRNITHRLEMEKHLKESEEKFSKVFQSNLIAFGLYTEAGVLVDLNKYFAALLENTPENLLGTNSQETKLVGKFLPADKAKIIETIKEIVALKGDLRNFETQIYTKDGRRKDILLSIEPSFLKEQKHWLISAIDIADKKNAELQLQSRELKYRSLIEQASDGIIITDFEGTVLEVNKSICTMGGYAEEEFLGRNVEIFLPKEDVTANPLQIPLLLQGKALLYERRMLLKDGSVIDVEVNSKMSADNTLIGFVRDITVRKKAEEELRKSNERFELIAKATNDAIWDHDFINDETTGNQNLYELYNIKKGKQKITFDTFLKHIHPDERATIVSNMDTALAKKAPYISEEFRFRQQEDNYINIYDRAYIIYDNNGLPVRMLGIMENISSRVLSEKIILKEKELSDTIINSLPAVFYLYNKEGKFLRWNKNFEVVTGYSSVEMKLAKPLDFFSPDEQALLAAKIKSVFDKGSDNVEAHLLTKQGEKIPYYFSGMWINYEGEECLLGFGLDFSDKVKSRQALQDSEEKFRSLVEQAVEGVLILSPAGEMTYYSPAVLPITGYTGEKILHHNLFNYLHPDDVDMVKERFDKAIANPGMPVKGIVCRFMHKDGTQHWCEKTFTNMLHIPSINGIVENFRDVTEKIFIEKIIIAEKELSDSIINSLPGIFYLYNQKGEFIRWNKNLETITGYSRVEIKQKHPDQLSADGDSPLLSAMPGEVLLNGNMQDEILLLTKEQEKIPFFLNLIAIEYQDEPCTIAIGFNLTDRKKIERELLISNEHLEQKAAELIGSYAELERFAYIVSHDLQEPLRMVSSFLTLLKRKYETALDETAQKYIHFAVDGSERMRQLITDLLEYSRTGTNKELSPETDMNLVMDDVKKVFKTTIDETNAMIETGDLPVLYNTSKLQMFQLMQNLIGNALKYRSVAAPLIEVSAVEEDTKWLFQVKDNGIGFEPKFSEKIFIIFQRLHERNDFSGTGIGLSICKKIVEKNGGKIWVDSMPGVGSTFYFTISKLRDSVLVNDHPSLTVE